MALTRVPPSMEVTHGHKNVIINGNFDIWQRGDDVLSTLNAASYGPDGWLSNTNGYSTINRRWTKQLLPSGQTDILDVPTNFARFSMESFTGTNTAARYGFFNRLAHLDAEL